MDAIPAWVDGRLAPVGKLEVHRRRLKHKAVSVFVFCGDALLMQRRALGKYHSGGLWANTCCSHPHWGESAEVCADRRLREELGIRSLPLERRGGVEYRADVGEGLVEHEEVAVFVGRADRSIALSPDAAEVMETRWVRISALEARVRARPQDYAPWLRIYLACGLVACAASVSTQDAVPS